MLREIVLARRAGTEDEPAVPEKLEWWLKSAADAQAAAEHARSYQESWLRGAAPGVLDSMAVFESRLLGPARTLSLLVGAANDTQRHAIIKAGAAFQLAGSARRNLHQRRPDQEAAVQLCVAQHYAAAGYLEGTLPWLPVHTRVLPVSLDFSAGAPLRTAGELEARIEEIADEVAEKWLAVRIRAPRDLGEAAAARGAWLGNPLRRALAERAAAAAETHDRVLAAEARRSVRVTQALETEREVLLRKHPRWGEWKNLPDEELKALVWEKQLTALAQEFGVTDTAIRRRCDARGIKRPPQGYWLRANYR